MTLVLWMNTEFVFGCLSFVTICSSVDLFEFDGLSSAMSELLGILMVMLSSVRKSLKCFVMDVVVIMLRTFGV